jgi:membrane-bound lytic murein transglycosylase B
MGYCTLTLCLISVFVGCSTPPVPKAVAEDRAPVPAPVLVVPPSATSLETHVLAKLKALKLNHSSYRSQLTALLQDPKRPYERVLSLNLLGFLGKANYSVHYSERTLRHARKFLKENSSSLARAEKKYGVSKESIAALLWVETQYGAITGKHPLVQVFLSLLMADQPDVIKMLIKEGNDRRTIDEEIRKRFPDPVAF